LDSNHNKEIKIEGKDLGASDKKPIMEINVKELDRIVFRDNKH
jgi:hypothetical protein